MLFEAGMILILLFFSLMLLNVPISACIGISSFASVMLMMPTSTATFTSAQKMVSSLDSFALIAIPFFIFSGLLMSSGGIAQRLVNLAQVLSGRIPGSLSQTNIMGNALFGCVSGSAIAASTAIGGVMIPFAVKEGYDRDFAAAANIASAPVGMLIPPTTSFIIYATVAGGASISAMFIGGAIAGSLWALGCMLVVMLIAHKKGYARPKSATYSEAIVAFKAAFPSLLLIAIIIGGITFGIFSPIEASAVAVIYTLLLTLVIYRSITLKDLKPVAIQTFVITSVVMFLLAASATMSFAMAFTGIPNALNSLILSITQNPILLLLIINVLLLIINVLLLIIGMFFDIGAAILIFTPILLPLALKAGITAEHFGVIMVFNLCLGTITPPVGTGLFVGSSIGKLPVSAVIKPLLPHYLVIILILLLITYQPAIVMGLPKLLGL